MTLTKKEYDELNHYLNTVADFIQGLNDYSVKNDQTPTVVDACYCLGKLDGILRVQENE